MKKCECQQCGKVFKSETDLKDHELNQHKVFPRTPKPQTRKDDVVEKCNDCNKTFTKEKNTERASQIVDEHKAVCGDKYRCDQFFSKATTKTGFNEHMKLHEESASPDPKRTKIEIEDEAVRNHCLCQKRIPMWVGIIYKQNQQNWKWTLT